MIEVNQSVSEPAAEAARFELPAQVRQEAASHLGEVAVFLLKVAEELEDPSRPVPTAALRVGAQALYDVSEAVATAMGGELKDADGQAVPPLPSSLKVKRVAREVYPDLPFYTEIVTVDQIPSIPLPPSERAIVVRIIDSKQIEINGTILELEGDQLYMINALLVHRDQPTLMPVLLGHGFRRGPNDNANKYRASEAAKELSRLLASVLPDDVEAILESGGKRWRTRQLSPLFVIEDARDHSLSVDAVPVTELKGGTHPEYSITLGGSDVESGLAPDLEAVPGPAVTLDKVVESTAPKVTVRPERMHYGSREYTIRDIAKATGLDFATVWVLTHEGRQRIMPYNSAESKPLPPKFASRIIARCQDYKAALTRLESVPGGYTLVAELVSDLPPSMTVKRANELLAVAGNVPFRLELSDPSKSRVMDYWCIRAEGAREVVLADLLEEAAASAVLKQRVSKATPMQLRTAGEIVARIHAEHGVIVTAVQVHRAGAEDRMIRAVNEDGQLRYSDYAYRKIASVLMQNR